MALKTNLTEEERYGLSAEEIKLATRWLRDNKTAGIIDDLQAAKLFELFLLGEPIVKLAQNFPQYPIGQIAFTAAYKCWPADRDRMMSTLKDRVQAKVVKSVLDQVDFLTSMMAVANAEHLDAMSKYVRDPVNTPKPALRIESIKDYKDIVETLSKLVTGATAGSGNSGDRNKSSSMMAALSSHNGRALPAPKERVEEVTIMDIDNGN